MSDERERLGDKTSISLKTACIVIVVAIIPLTLFVGSISNGLETIRVKVDTNLKEINSKVDVLEAVLDTRRKPLEDQFNELVRRMADQEVRLRVIEKTK